MKRTLALALLLSGSAFAGSTAKAPIAPPPQPELWSWFVGASAGYMEDLETGLYTGHVGVDTPWQVAGWNTALYLEGGWAGKEEDFLIAPPPNTTSGLLPIAANAELDVVPVTFNVKFERPFGNGWHAYLGAGLGVSFVDIEVSSALGTESDDDTVFTAQVFGGVGYDLNEDWEIYGGARWMYFDDPSFNDAAATVGLDLDDNVVFELGVRYTF